jgi:hypothetical protein
MMARDKAGCDTLHLSAALVKFNASATGRKYLIWNISTGKLRQGE